MNDYDDIESKYQKLIALANQLSSKELSSGLSEGMKSTKPKSLKRTKKLGRKERRMPKERLVKKS